MSQKRTKGVSLSRPIIYGNEAYRIPHNELSQCPPNHTHRWKVFVRGIHNEDLSWMIKKVTFKLHSSFTNANRAIEAPPYEIEETGWGEFEVPIKIKFHDGSDREVLLSHNLQLHPRDQKLSAENSLPISRVLDPGNGHLISERYEEILFFDPPESFCKLALQHPLAIDAPQHPVYNASFEKKLIQDYEAATKRAKADQQGWTAKLNQAKLELENLKSQHNIYSISENSTAASSSRHPL